MKKSTLLSSLYLLNGTVLICHEIDSAYWHEWELFRIPGGIQLFLLLNLPLVAIILYGYGKVLNGAPTASAFSWLVIAGGLLAAGIHGFFLLQGDPAFRLPVSIALIGTAFVLSVLQAVTTVTRRA